MAASIALSFLPHNIPLTTLSPARNKVRKNKLLTARKTSATCRSRGISCTRQSDRGDGEKGTPTPGEDPGCARRRSLVGMVATAVILSHNPHAQALDTVALSPSTTFQRTCVGCHAGGGNVLQAGAGLSSPDLKRNGLDSVEGVYEITNLGKGRMPGYGHECKPKGQCTFGPRLSEGDMRALASYVLEQAESGWQ